MTSHDSRFREVPGPGVRVGCDSVVGDRTIYAMSDMSHDEIGSRISWMTRDEDDEKRIRRGERETAGRHVCVNNSKALDKQSYKIQTKYKSK